MREASAGARRLPLLGSPPDPPALPEPLPLVVDAGPRPVSRYYLETWGCQMNVYDSERFQGQLRALGYVPSPSDEGADLILLNTCSVREKAEEKLFSRLGRLRALKQQNPELVIGVAGCVAQQEQDRILRRSDLVDFVIGTKAVPSLPRLLERARAGERAIDVEMRADRFDEVIPVERNAPHRAYVTVVEGCNKTCSFCIVPTTRGPEVNRAPASIEAEVRTAIAGGAVEVELLGQNVNAYRHGEVGFAELLRKVDAIDGVRRLRFTTSHPRELTDDVIEAMAGGEHVANALHLPVQSGSDSVLRRMYRGYDRARYLSRAARLRARIPDLALSTDIIVGFPGETEAEFGESLRLLEEVQFDQVFAFVYSARPGTRAAELADPVPRAEKEERLQRLFALQDAITRELNARQLGRTVEVLVDGPSSRDDGRVCGRSRDGRIVNFVPAPGRRAGDLVPIAVTRTLPHSLLGEELTERGDRPDLI